MDASHANVWHDAGRAELAPLASGPVDGPALSLERELPANSVDVIELTPNPIP